MGELSAVPLVLPDRVKDGRPVQLLHEALGGEGVACAGRGEFSFRRRLERCSEPPAHLRTGEGGLSEGGGRIEELFWEEGRVIKPQEHWHTCFLHTSCHSLRQKQSQTCRL